MKKHRGFTLVEVLVTIAIIGILAAIVYANFGDARAKARDDVRKSSLKELQLAVELYKADNGDYPSPGCGGTAGNFYGPGPAGGGYNSCLSYIDGLVPTYIGTLPIDPSRENEAGLGFYYRSDGDAYKILVRGVELQTLSDYTDEFSRCPNQQGSGPCVGATPPATEYAVYSIGAEDW